jgi:lipid-A-disaccharide synthase-like uncharacterized protein
MKPAPIAAMVSLIVLAIVLVASDDAASVGSSEGASQSVEIRLGGRLKGQLEWLEAEDRFLMRLPGRDPAALSRAELSHALGPSTLDELFVEPPNWLFRVFNVTSWASFVWVAVGILGQLAFFLRMAVQWIVSEKRGESVVPQAFWWLSMFGGMALYVYFIWRKDVIAALGQSTGIVIYARNLRLIHKGRQRSAE